MDTTLFSTSEWAQAEFGDVFCGDVRRKKRLVRVAKALIETPNGTLPPAIPKWAELKSAYRLFGIEEVAYENIIEPHCKRIRQICGQGGEYLLIEDTTQIDFTFRKNIKGLGRIGDDGGKGFYVHTTLAACIEEWEENGKPKITVPGLFNQTSWIREGTSKRGQGEKTKERLSRERESQRWASIFKQTGGPCSGNKWIYIADRESDIYEVFEECQKNEIDFIVRANQRRALEGLDISIFDAIGKCPVQGKFEIELRTRPNIPARKAVAEVRTSYMTLRGPWRPGGRVVPFSLNVVEVREIEQPKDVEPIRWVLMTSLPIKTLKQVKKIIGAYSRRWIIEEYHKALKTGTGIESSQLSDVNRIRALLGVLSVVAVRLLNMKLLASALPDKPILVENFEPEIFKVLETKFAKPKGGWNNGSLLTAIARMGGFLARKSDGNPGWITIWRGWKRLTDMAYGYRLASGTEAI